MSILMQGIRPKTYDCRSDSVEKSVSIILIVVFFIFEEVGPQKTWAVSRQTKTKSTKMDGY